MASCPNFSPDGRWIAYSSPGSGTSSVFVRPVDGEGKWQVSIREGDRPRWSPDGGKIIYLDNADTLNEAEVDGSGTAFQVGMVRPLFEIQAYRPGTVYDVMPDGSGFLINERLIDMEMSRVVLVQNWPGALAQ